MSASFSQPRALARCLTAGLLLGLFRGAFTAALAGDPTVLLWDTSDSRPMKYQPVVAHTSIVTRAVFSPDGKRLLTVSGNGGTVFWNVSTGRKIGQWGPAQHNWTFELGQARYGFTLFGPTDTSPGSCWLVWRSQTHRIQPPPAWAVTLAVVLLLGVMGTAAYRHFGRNRRRTDAPRSAG